MSAAAFEDFEALSASKVFREGVESGAIVGTRRVDGVSPPEGALPAAGFAAVLEHDLLPFVSWPYEWTFTMLKDAALSQLDLLDRAIDEGLILKDGTPYNTQFVGTRPVFIDIASIERLREGSPWEGYRQFCMMFLYPLMLQAFRGVDFQPFLRGNLDGITPEVASNLLSRRDRLRRGVPTHVALHARLERKHSDESARSTQSELKKAGFSPKLIKANVAAMRRLIKRLKWDRSSSEWSGYAEGHTYSDEGLDAKGAFVDRAMAEWQPAMAWDVGCNDGRFSRIAAKHAGTVVAMDFDHLTVDRLYRQLRDEDERRILPLVMNFADPSPDLGWRESERAGLHSRARVDALQLLAVVHHMTIGAGVPVPDWVDWLRGFDACAVVEFPRREDEMVQRLLSRKRAGAHPDYELDTFESALRRGFEIERREEIGSRVIFQVRPSR